jgi:tetratricopeptide (TPR) repeat protein
MTLGLDYVLWGMNPTGYHLTNLLLHAANAVLIYFVARRLLLLAGAVSREADPLAVAAPAAFAALLFSLHPLRVESVAWITERRDVLSLFFYSLSVLAYLRWCDGGARRRSWYGVAVAAFIAALLSKATAVTLPALLMILNVYPLGRIGARGTWTGANARRVYLELVPFALLSAATGALSIVALHPGHQLSAGTKVAVSAYSLGFYLWKTIAPVGLAPLYEMPKHVDPWAAPFVASYAAVIALTGLAWIVRRRWPGATAAWLAFLVIILPMLGVVQNGPQIAADRYTYHASPALAIVAGAGLFLLARGAFLARAAIGGAILAVLGALTWNQTGVWHDSERLWSRVLEIDSTSSIAQTALGNVLVKEDRLDEAIAHYRRSLVLDTLYVEVDNNIGIALGKQGNLAEAIEHYRRAVRMKTDYYEAHNNWGAALARQGDVGGAITHYQEALRIKPDYDDAQVNWGNALVRLDRPEEAIPHYQEALRIRPDNADAQHNWGVALARQGKLAESIEHFRLALALKPDHAEAKEYLDRAMRLQQARQAPK